MNSQLTPNFTVGEALYLPSWKVYHKPSQAEKDAILALANKLEQVRVYLGNNPINVNCWIRPMVVVCDNPFYNGKNYNQLVGGAQNSAHIYGMACDFTVSRWTCDDVRHVLLDRLAELDLRMERKQGAGWVHLDTRQPNPDRYFRP